MRAGWTAGPGVSALPDRRQRRRARAVNVRVVLAEVRAVEARPLRPLGHELLEVLVEDAVAALPDHLGVGQARRLEMATKKGLPTILQGPGVRSSRKGCLRPS